MDSTFDILSRMLRAWFNENARDLPWRRTADPYAIWVSEVMLQQTQVQTVIPYWLRWIEQLPTIHSLAAAPLPVVLKLWEGLGYYTRVQNLRRAAQAIVERHDGSLPSEYDALLDLPGVGPYTAGALSSIAFDQPQPVVDGNVIRVLTRLCGISGNVKTARVKFRLWSLARQLVEAAARDKGPGTRPCSSLNQALMELGAIVCLPKTPDCPRCPVQNHCVARRTGRVSRLPNLGKRPASTPRHFVAFIASHQDRLFIRQRPGQGVNAHLWEFPNTELFEPVPKLRRLARQSLGFDPGPLALLGTIHHSITRFRIRLDAYLAEPTQAVPALEAKGKWAGIAEVGQLAFPAAHRKILKAWTLRQSAAAG